MSLDPQIQALVAAMAQPGRPLLHELPIAEAREAFVAMPALLGDLGHHTPSEDRRIDGPLGPVPLRIYTPEGDAGPRPLVLFFHGGGFCIGGLDSHDRECQSLAARAGAVVVSVDYRMGPEHAYTAADERPAWIEDSWAALRWAAANAADLGADPARLVVCGDSAGGNISAVMAQLALDDGLPLALQALIYPATDVRDEAYDLFPSYAENADAAFLASETLDYFKVNARPDGDAASPTMSPALRADLSGLAPAVVITASHDPLRDDGEAYAARLAEAGVPVTSRRFEGMPHAFFNLGPVVGAADEALTLVVDAITAL